MTRLDEELALLRRRFENLAFRADGQWVRIPEFRIPEKLWQPSLVQIAFQVPLEPATAPYGFHARPLDGELTALRLVTGQDILNYTHPTTTPWGNDWGTFSWALEAWEPSTPITQGTTMLDFARSIAGRFAEGA